MGTTTNFGWPYPDSSSNTQIWAHFSALASAQDTTLALYKARGVMATPVTTSTNGTATSATTDTRDAVLGNYVFTAVAGRRYRVIVEGMGLSGTVAADRFDINVRDGGASTPTSASSSIAKVTHYVPAAGGPGQVTIPLLIANFTPSAGTHTLSVFVQRTTGTGAGTPLYARSIYVEDIGV